MLIVTRISKKPLRFSIEQPVGDWVYVGYTRTQNGFKPRLRWNPRLPKAQLRSCDWCRFAQKDPVFKTHVCALGFPMESKKSLFATYCPEFDKE